ncbi:ADP compounds hydrolase NudE [Planctobacterium marinum]|uniref:ADP compounds hydrolase NudE n=1 Tax=Planctobacterium marinum TaxID=1631968 RepID=A0AA48HLC8_9ALTE|nr:ADP compounds hydrolase NudE [Planctobacterium marinum]
MSKTDSEKQLPIIHEREVVARSRLFKLEQVHLEFSNGEKRVFERMAGSGRGAVMIVPMVDNNRFLLVREYAAGLHEYQLGFPKGLIDPGESPEQAANRELKEEVGFGAKQLEALSTVTMAPTFFSAHMHILLAHDLYPEKLPGDEPEPLEVVEWSFDNMDALLNRTDFTEARCIAALMLAHKRLNS